MLAIVCAAVGLQSIRACLDILFPLSLSKRLGLSPSDLSSTMGKRWYGVFIAMACGAELARRTSRFSVPALLCTLGVLMYILGSYCDTIWSCSLVLGISGALVSVAAMCTNVLVQTANPESKSRNNTIYRVCGNITYSVFSLLLGQHVILQDDDVDTLQHVYVTTTCVVLVCAGSVYAYSSETKPSREGKNHDFSSLLCSESRDLIVLSTVLAILATCAATSRSMIEPRFVGNLSVSGSTYGSIHAASSFVSLLSTILVGRMLMQDHIDARFALIFLAFAMSLGMILVTSSSSSFLSSAGVILSRAAEESAKVPCNVWLANLASEHTKHDIATILSACIAFQKLFGAFMKAVAASIASELIRQHGVSGVFQLCAFVSIISACSLLIYFNRRPTESSKTK
eukprot:g6146.t1